MLRKFLTILFLLFLSLFFSCNNESSFAAETIHVNLHSDTDYYVKWDRLLALESSDDALFGPVEKMLFFDNKIYVLDNTHLGALLVFNSDGRLFCKTTSGKGPEECLSISDFYLDERNREITVLDIGNGRLMTYDFNLQLKRSKTTNIFFRKMHKTSDGKWLVFYQNPLPGDKKNSKLIYSYLLYSANFDNLVEKYMPDDREWKTWLLYPPMSKNNDEVFMLRPADPIIYSLDPDLTLSKRYYINSEKYTIDEEDKIEGSLHVSKLLNNNERINLIGDLLNNDSYFALTFAFNKRPEFMIYNKMNKQTTTSLNIKNLPKGILRGLVGNKFVLQVKAYDLIEFLATMPDSSYSGVNYDPSGNDLLLYFSLPNDQTKN